MFGFGFFWTLQFTVLKQKTWRKNTSSKCAINSGLLLENYPIYDFCSIFDGRHFESVRRILLVHELNLENGFFA